MIRTDLAAEAKEFIDSSSRALSGVSTSTADYDGINISRIEITSERGAEAMGHPIGTYITVDTGEFRKKDSESFKSAVMCIARQLRSVISIKSDDSILIVGLGNKLITADALGPKVTEYVMVTRHVQSELEKYFDPKLRAVSAICPGVLGQTGIETGELIKGTSSLTKPSLIIAIDALAARSVSRIARTVQISDAGITPGAGVGNARFAINKDTLGVPVIAIGVPTVVDAATMVGDILEQVNDSALSEKEQNHMRSAIRKAIEPSGLNLVVTPTDIDAIIDDTAKAVGFAINQALFENVSFEDMQQYVS